MLINQFQTTGRDLCSRGLVCSNSGNMSVRMGDRLVITRRGSMLGCIEENDLIETGIEKNDRFTPLASTELPVHRAIYQATSALAIVHAHPPHAVAISMLETEIIPNCNEASPMMERVPVLGWNMEVKPGGLADIISNALKQYRIVMVRGHGSFAVGQLLEEAHNYTTLLEASCQVLCLLRSLQVNELK